MFVDIIQIMVTHPNREISSAGNKRQRKIRTFLSYINLSIEAIDLIRNCQNGGNGNAVLEKIFPNGWLSLHGTFESIGYREHESSCQKVTGFPSSDEACEAGWIKLSTGLPINHRGEVLISHLADKKRLSRNQTDWLNHWLNFVERNRKSMAHFTI